MDNKEIDKAAGEILLEYMRDAGCAEHGIEAAGFAIDERTLEIAVMRADYWLGLMFKPTPTAESLREQVLTAQALNT